MLLSALQEEIIHAGVFITQWPFTNPQNLQVCGGRAGKHCTVLAHELNQPKTKESATRPFVEHTRPKSHMLTTNGGVIELTKPYEMHHHHSGHQVCVCACLCAHRPCDGKERGARYRHTDQCVRT